MIEKQDKDGQGGKAVNDQQYFITTSLSYQLKAARRELESFRSGEIYQKLRADYERVIREQNLTIKKLRRERDEFSFSRKEITKQWMDVLDDMVLCQEKVQLKNAFFHHLRLYTDRIMILAFMN